MMHPLAVELLMHVAVAVEQLGREDAVEHLGFLQAQDVRLLLDDQPLDQRRARAHRLMFQEAIFSLLPTARA